MKIIVSEEQYKLIENLIDEARKPPLSKDVQRKLGAVVTDWSDNVHEGTDIEFVLASGNKIVLQCVTDNNYVFTFKVIEDSANVLKKRDTISIYFNPGNGEIDDPTYEYSLNQKIISTSDNGNTFDLLVNGAKKTGIKGDLIIPKIQKINYKQNTSQAEPQDVPRGTSSEPQATGTTTGTTTEPEKKEKPKPETQKQGKIALEMILKDENLKKAFYSAPSLWKLFVAELQGKQAEGKGIITVLHLVDDYEKKQMKTNLGGEFIEGGFVAAKPIKSFYFPYKIDGKRNKYKFDTLIDYQGKVLPKKLGENYILYGPIRDGKGLKFSLEILKPNAEFDNTFSCNVFLFIDEKTKYRYPNKVDFQVDLEHSNGFKPHVEEKKTK